MARGFWLERGVPPYMRGDITPPDSGAPILSHLDLVLNRFLRQDFKGFLMHLERVLDLKF